MWVKSEAELEVLYGMRNSNNTPIMNQKVRITGLITGENCVLSTASGFYNQLSINLQLTQASSVMGTVGGTLKFHSTVLLIFPTEGSH